MPEVVNLVSSEDEGDVQATELHGPGTRRRASDRASAGETVDLVSSDEVEEAPRPGWGPTRKRARTESSGTPLQHTETVGGDVLRAKSCIGVNIPGDLSAPGGSANGGRMLTEEQMQRIRRNRQARNPDPTPVRKIDWSVDHIFALHVCCGSVPRAHQHA